MEKTNPIIKADFPDPNVIRVGDTYYMLCATMHFMPGGVILRSYDLKNWEIASHMFEALDGTPEERMQGERCNYGRGMWAGSIRYANDKFYVCFSAQETDTTYIYTSESIEGPWEITKLPEYRHHPSLLFDDDGRVYMVSGFLQILLREMLPDLSGYKPDGLKRTLLAELERETVQVGYEGSCLQKINGKYYLMAIYWPKREPSRKTQLCYKMDTLESELVGGEVLCDDMGYHNQGIAQGELLEAPNGKWFSIMFQDYGAVGRIPVLVPVTWQDDMPVFGRNGKVPKDFPVVSSRPYYQYTPIYASDDFNYPAEEGEHPKLKCQWEWNHIPDERFWRITPEGGFCIRNGKICSNVAHGVNTLTQRSMWPKCGAEVTIDASGLKDGDVAGLCALQGCYGLIGVTKEHGSYYLVMINRYLTNASLWDRAQDYMPGRVMEKIKLTESTVRVRMNLNFEDMQDTAEFYYQTRNRWKKLGVPHNLYFRLDHFVGCRIGLFNYATKEIGGEVMFRDFRYVYEE